MAEPTAIAPAHAAARVSGDRMAVELSGAWSVTEPHPGWSDVVSNAKEKLAVVAFSVEGVTAWDSALVLFAVDASRWASERGAVFETKALPDGIVQLLGQLSEAKIQAVPEAPTESLLHRIGVRAVDALHEGQFIANFIGEVTLGFFALLRRPGKFRWRDCLSEMQQCGAMALPIVGLINFLAGVTLAYTGAVILRQYGADILDADLVGLSMVREMGAVMTATILAGRTGAAFAAEIGNMKANEEVDALITFGFSPTDFLVMPKVIALAVMMPLLALYANGMGIIGGAVVAHGVLQIPPSAYWIEMLTSVSLTDVSAGLIKALTFGIIVGFSGCLRGLQADRSAAGVGRAATSAVVTAILLMVIADALYAVVFNVLGI
jgi:phospholipid/cholesterol/gamma-HCH transport system permease protein